MLPLSDRVEAGRLLAGELASYADRPNVIVAGLPRGGVPVAAQIATRLHAELDVVVVRKLGVPWEPELAIGAVGSGGARILDRAIIDELGLTERDVEAAIAQEEKAVAELEKLFRRDKPAKSLTGKTVILTDDGAATGSTMLAAAQAARMQQPQGIIIAVPVASRQAYMAFKKEAGKCVCLATPEPFLSVSRWYRSFGQTNNAEVEKLLSRA